MDSHLVSVPGLGTFTIWSLTGGNSQSLGWHTDWPLAEQALVLGTLDEVGTDLLEGLDVAGGEVDADLVDAGFLQMRSARRRVRN